MHSEFPYNTLEVCAEEGGKVVTMVGTMWQM